MAGGARVGSQEGVMTGASEKQILRAEMRARLRAIPAEARKRAAKRVCDRIRAERRWQEAESVLLYWALPDELDLRELLREALEAGKRAALPRYDPETSCYVAVVPPVNVLEMAAGQFGILEPPSHHPILPLNRLDFAVAPGLAFDLSGRRLGRGKGFYDRLLANVRGLKCGVCLDEQIQSMLPAEPHDVTLNCLATPSRWLEFGPAAVLK
jgi:5-formyltetrahydrofolate cyclo-ligase